MKTKEPKERGIIRRVIEATQDDHVHIMVRTPGRPALDIDLSDAHGRRVMSVRVEGMSVFSALVDVKELPAMDDQAGWVRFCPFCGEEINQWSSKAHVCKELPDA